MDFQHTAVLNFKVLGSVGPVFLQQVYHLWGIAVKQLVERT